MTMASNTPTKGNKLEASETSMYGSQATLRFWPHDWQGLERSGPTPSFATALMADWLQLGHCSGRTF